MMLPSRTNGLTADGLPAMRAFRVQLAIAVVLYTITVYALLYFQSQRLLSANLRAQGASYFDLVYHTRAWNAGYGGVWVLKRPGIETNQYLLEMGIPADVKTVEGTEFTLRNPSLMTREISQRTLDASGVSFHLVSRDPVNPQNTADEWELASLEQFESDDSVVFTESFDRDARPPVYRYMEPLRVDQTCLTCHKNQGYEVDDVRGAVSVAISTLETDNQLERTALMLLILTGATLALGMSLSQWFVSRLGRRLEDANQRLVQMAVTDELTGLPNRRSVLERLATEYARSKRTGAPLSVLALDIDHFKNVNDVHGHGVGDAVLREIASRMSGSIREYDGVGRIGGEEFLIVAPDTDTPSAVALADRVLQAIRATPIQACEVTLGITASAGVSTMRAEDARIDDMVGRADTALYAAKAAGRDRTSADPGT